MQEIFTREVKTISSNGTQHPIIAFTPGARVHGGLAAVTYTGGTNTVAGCMTAISEIRMKAGNEIKTRINGTRLRDFFMLHGTAYDFGGLPNTATNITLPFAPEWFLDSVADALAWNPAKLGGPITVEIDASVAITVKCYERISFDLEARSTGILTLETILPVVGGTESWVKQPEFQCVGKLVSASIYPDSAAATVISEAGLRVGKDWSDAHVVMATAQNNEVLERFQLTPDASGRTADIYDLVFVRGDALTRAMPLDTYSQAALVLKAATSLSGNCPIVLARITDIPAPEKN